MNSDVLSAKNEKLAKSSNAQAHKHNNPNVHQVTHGIPDVRLNNVRHPTEQKVNLASATTSSAKNISLAKSVSGKRQTHKLVDSKQVSGPFQQSDKKTFLLDTYARIAAINNKRCPKRVRELAKPKRQIHSERNNYTASFDSNYYHTIKPYGTETNRNLKESKK